MFFHKIQLSCSIEEFAFEEEIHHCHCYIVNLRHIVKETGKCLKDKFDHQNMSVTTLHFELRYFLILQTIFKAVLFMLFYFSVKITTLFSKDILKVKMHSKRTINKSWYNERLLQGAA